MTHDKKTAVPELRFPEFRDSGEWEMTRLTAINRVLTNSAEKGIIDQRDYFDKDIANQNNLGGYYIVNEGDYVYNPRISNIAPVGPLSKNRIGKGVMSPLYTIFRFNKKTNDFYEQYFKSTYWHKYLKEVSNKGARFDRMSITPNIFMDMPVPSPSLAEQQKIADCLSSIDDLIAITAEEIELLKQYKKGLMQQLFPANGKTTPELRFPEFKDSGEWEEKTLGEIALIVKQKNTSNSISRILTNSAERGIIDQKDFFDRDIVSQNNLINYYIVAQGDYVYNPRKSKLAPVGPVSKNMLGVGIVSPLYIVFRFENEDNYFYAHYFKFTHWHNYLNEVSNKGARFDRMSISSKIFMNMPIPFPKQIEQQKIADCLSSIDEQISMTEAELSCLKEIKKGLMQRLFV